MDNFEDRLRQALAKIADDPEAAADDFHDMYEGPVLGADDIYSGLQRLPRPYRELAAAHQCWGIVASDGFENYVEATDSRFDAEVEACLRLLGHGECFAAIPEARRVLEADNDLSEEQDVRLWTIFYDPIANFHELVGKYLLRHFNLAEPD